MHSDSALLNAVPEFFRFDALLKATPIEEGGRRVLFFEASNEDVDHQNEVVLQKALAESAAYFLRHGNIDLSHYSIMGPKSGLANFMEYEIGRPIDVRVNGKATFVKAELYSGDSPQARNASMVWDSLTKQQPASRWYPSVGGAVLHKSIKLDPSTGQKVAVVDKVRWNNVALDRCPVNRTVGEVSLAPVGTFAKAFGGFVMGKSLEVGHGTDVATLTGGGALQQQSLDRRIKRTTPGGDDFGMSTYVRDQLAAAIRARKVRPERGEMRKALISFGLSPRSAAAGVERFLSDLRAGLCKE